MTRHKHAQMHYRETEAMKTTNVTEHKLKGWMGWHIYIQATPQANGNAVI